LQDGGTYGLVDNLTYTYNGNQLTKISDSVEDPTYVGAFNFRDGADSSAEYTYDAVGNMTSDKNKGITSITYNDINQPQKITFSDGKTTEYVYSYDGTKLQTVHKTQQPQTSNTTTYCGNLIYENGALKQMLVDGGYVTFSGATPVYHFYIQDHLGNNRVVAKADGTVGQINHYYPYGGLMADICTGSDVQPYKYNGKELDRMHGLDTYDYGARQHNAATGRWDRMDQKCEKYYDISPYVFCMDNPISYTDANGDSIYFDMPAIKNGTITGYTRYTYGKYGDTYGFGRNGELYQGNNKTIGSINDALNKISSGGEYGRRLISGLSGSTSMDTKISYDGAAITKYAESSKEISVSWNPLDEYGAGVDENGGIETPAYITLAHELYHAEDYINNGNKKAKTWLVLPPYNQKISYKEYRTCIKENHIRAENKLPLRKYYVSYSNGKPYEPSLIFGK